MYNYILAAIVILSVFQTEMGLSSTAKEIPEVKEETYYEVNLCEYHDDCREPCGNLKGLKPRCDNSGVCVCDCSNMETVNSHPIPEVCKKPIPSHGLDSCVKYSGDIYNRASAKICGKIGVYAFCVSLCKAY